MKIIANIIISIIIFFIWIKILKKHINKNIPIFYIIFFSVISICSILFFWYVTNILIEKNIIPIYLKNILYFLWIFLLSFFTNIYWNKLKVNNKNTKKLFISIIVLWIIFLTLWYFFEWISFLIISIFSEEIIKFSNSNKLSNILWKTDIIFLSIVIWLWFGFFETLFSIVKFNTEIIIFRNIFTILIHIVSTGTIALLFIKLNKKYQTFFSYLIAIFIWFFLHIMFDISLKINFVLLTILILIVNYFLLTYIIYNSNKIYETK